MSNKKKQLKSKPFLLIWQIDVKRIPQKKDAKLHIAMKKMLEDLNAVPFLLNFFSCIFT